KFTYMNMMWLRHPEQLTDLSLAADYDPMKRFDSLDGKLQGQLRELQQAVPSKFHEEFTNILFWKEFKSQMQQQRSNGITRIRHTVGASIFDCKPSELDTATARMKFKEDIGFIEEADGTTRYKSLCLILYKDYEGHHEKRKIFLNPSLFQARYTLSVDMQLQPVGSSTNIHYQDDFEYYLKYLHKGVQTEDRHIMAIFRTWNEHFY
ncbi:hypothetical protein M422DRAFT_90756, partial [Sphaerobolus stellatus SS14]